MPKLKPTYSKPSKAKFTKPLHSARPAPRPARPEPEVEMEPAPAILPFDQLGLDPGLLLAVTAAGYESPTPIQSRAIPPLLEGRDLLGQAQTGTGKTAAYALPLIQRCDIGIDATQAIILAPTRELAVQVAGEVYGFSRASGLRVVPVYGGQPIEKQFRALKTGAHIVVGTPGRILDHLRRGSLVLDSVQTCVLDEADEMLALGFLEDIETVLAAIPPERQLALFAATMPSRVAWVAKKFLRDPVRVIIESKKRTLETTNQTYYEVPAGKKLEALCRVLDMETPGPTIVFCRTRNETGQLSDELRLRGYGADGLHGDMAQHERDRVMKRFREGQTDLLVATDVAARGLDIETVTHVINYDIPWDAEQYIHRIGRTGRAGREGDAITLIEPRERRQLRNIEQMIGSRLKPVRIPTAADISARRLDRNRKALRDVIERGEGESHMAIASELAEDYDPLAIAAAALSLLWGSSKGAEEPEEDTSAFAEYPETGMARLLVSIGRKEGLRPGDLVGAIAHEAGLTGKEIGVIELMDHMAFVEVPAAATERVISALSRTKLRGQRVRVTLAKQTGSA